MKRDQQGCTLNFDLLLPGCGELIGGSLREHDFNSLNERSPADLSWYVNLRLDGYPYLAGFGLGIERLIMSILGLSNVKDTIPFPRWKGQCAF
ncbi:hypothetical protein GJ496_010597 [Pomphorhynchus laevis]|nr:hypothetical protein GJ496_010597 [Pomphorhynchus laevis]